MSQRLSLLELNEATCHWPIGDPASSEFFFCGGKALDQPALLRASLADRLSAGQRPPPPAAEAERQVDPGADWLDYTAARNGAFNAPEPWGGSVVD